MKNFNDERLIDLGLPMYSEGYSDQPYVVQTDDGAWLCAVTTGRGEEGESSQHVVSFRSRDRGKSWELPVAVEPADGPEASYSVLLKTPSGRIYCFYNHNTDNIREVLMEDGTVVKRVDSLGHYVFKYSDDHGRSWSVKRYDVPVREFECDRHSYAGRLRFFWNVGRPLILGNTVLLVIHKVGVGGVGRQAEGAFMLSDNLLSEVDPEKINFITLPDGDIGLRTPAGGGRVAEEQSVTVLSDGSLFCVYRTEDGWPACSYSRDGGHVWLSPQYLTYAPGGRRIKNPRGPNFVWRCGNGRYLYWFYNHGGRFIREVNPFEDRNPVWLMAGREISTPGGTFLEWSQPEILLYSDDPFVSIGYPDLIEENGSFWVTETQKFTGRIHAISPILLGRLFRQGESAVVMREGLILELTGSKLPGEASMPRLPDFSIRDWKLHAGKDTRFGFTLEVLFKAEFPESGQIVLDSRSASGSGFALQTSARGTLELILNDGRSENRWDCDPLLLRTGKQHRVTFIVDGGPKLILVLVDGVLCDGGEARQFGWGRFNPNLRNVTGGESVRVGTGVSCVRIYNRALLVSEAVGNYIAGKSEIPAR